MTHPGFPGGVRTGTRPISGAAPLLQQIFSCSGCLAAWVASEFWPSPYAGVCTARFVLYVQMYIPALSLHMRPSLPLSNSSPATTEATGLFFAGCGFKRVRGQKSLTVPPLFWAQTLRHGSLLIVLHYHEGSDHAREGSERLQMTSTQHPGLMKKPRVERNHGQYACTLHTYDPRAGRAYMPSDGDVASPHALP